MSGQKKSPRFIALFESLITSLLWASSFVLVKLILKEIGPLTTAGLRYFIAFLILAPFLFKQGAAVRNLKPRVWFLLLLVGISAYTIGNGAFFWGLKYLSPTTTSLILSMNPILILLAGIWWLKEIPTRTQIIGFMICLAGTIVFFLNGLKAGEPTGLIITIVGLFGFAVFGILSRAFARDKQINTLILTAVPLGFGGGVLLILAIAFEGIPHLSWQAGGILLWLALANTAVAYMLYNHSLQILTALEMNVMLNLSPLGTALLAWLLLGERLSLIKFIGMVVVIAGVILVQQRKKSQVEIEIVEPILELEQ